MIPLTILVDPNRRHCGKTFYLDPQGKPARTDSANVEAWQHRRLECVDTTDFFARVQKASRGGACIAIRGAIADGAPQIANRRMVPRGPADTAHVVAAPCPWLMLDFDLPWSTAAEAAWTEIKALDPEERIVSFRAQVLELVARKFPKWAQGVRMLVHLSSSFAGKKAGMHVFLVLDRAIAPHRARHWAKEMGADPAVMSYNQPHFLSNPRFLGVEDPVDGVIPRWIEIPGREFATMPANEPAWDSENEVRSTTPLDASAFQERPWTPRGEVAVEHMIAVAASTPDGSRHSEYMRTLRRLHTRVVAGDLDLRCLQEWWNAWSMLADRERRNAIASVFGDLQRRDNHPITEAVV